MNHLEEPIFYFFSLTAILSSVAVVTNRRPTYGVLALAVTMLALSGLFILLKAYFVAVVQVLIYAGAILVLFLFVIMLLGVGKDNPVRKPSRLTRIIHMVFPLLFFTELLMLVFLFTVPSSSAPEGLQGTVEAIGETLFSDYLLPFELISGILLIGIFGVVNLSHKELQRKA